MLPTAVSAVRALFGSEMENEAPRERMRIWSMRAERDAGRLGVARLAVGGASREELLKEALKALRREGNADRIGVWIEAEPSLNLQHEGPGRFQGLVWDRENGEMPQEWANLSVEPPLPEESLFAGKCVEQDLEAVPDRSIVGPPSNCAARRGFPSRGMGSSRESFLPEAGQTRR